MSDLCPPSSPPARARQRTRSALWAGGVLPPSAALCPDQTRFPALLAPLCTHRHTHFAHTTHVPARLRSTLPEADIMALSGKAEAVAKEKQPFERIVLTKSQALRMFADNPFKVALITVRIRQRFSLPSKLLASLPAGLRAHTLDLLLLCTNKQ